MLFGTTGQTGCGGLQVGKLAVRGLPRGDPWRLREAGAFSCGVRVQAVTPGSEVSSQYSSWTREVNFIK